MAGHRRHKGGHHEEEHENEERWLVSFADMMTLLFCLFMVLFAISSVNTSKFESLQRSLQDAFSGAVLSGGKAMLMGGGAFTTPRHVFWNFVSSSRDRINQAKEDWKAMRFALPPGDDQEFIPLPA